jgi:hypothetical protein
VTLLLKGRRPTQVIKAAKQRAAGSKHGWCYGGGCSAAGQSGSGNNWALGHNKFGPAMAPAVLELVRKQVAVCWRHGRVHELCACDCPRSCTATTTCCV